MFGAFVEVLQDLWVFATKQVFAKDTVVLLPAESVVKNIDPVLESTKASSTINTTPQLESRLCYVKDKRLLCLQTPHMKFDTLRGVLNYGDIVRVVQQKNNWSFVEGSAVQGWVKTQSLTTQQTSVFPDLQHGEFYDYQNSQTNKLRLYLEDNQLGDELGLPLQASEYIIYRLLHKGQNISWPWERPRLAGAWQRILQNKQGVAITSEPKTGSVLEGVNSNGSSFLAYVETVSPGLELEISSVGRLRTGEYEKLYCTKKQWQQWQPVFISFT